MSGAPYRNPGDGGNCYGNIHGREILSGKSLFPASGESSEKRWKNTSGGQRHVSGQGLYPKAAGKILWTDL